MQKGGLVFQRTGVDVRRWAGGVNPVGAGRRQAPTWLPIAAVWPGVGSSGLGGTLLGLTTSVRLGATEPSGEGSAERFTPEICCSLASILCR